MGNNPLKELERMMAQMAKRQGQAANGPDEDSMSDAELANFLRLTYASLSEITRFSPGDIIVHKYPAASNTVDAHRPVLFMGYLPKVIHGYDLPGTNADHISNHKIAARQDCTILRLISGHAVQFLEDSREYMLHPDFLTKH